MALDNKFRVSELVQSGSRAIISEDPISKTHTFIDGGATIISQSANVPYEHIEGERDGELTNYIEKPKYDETQLKRAVDTVIDELILPPLPPDPEVVPKPVYDDLLARYNEQVDENGRLRTLISSLEAQVAQLQGQIQSLLNQLDAAEVARAIAENQAQQTNEKYADLLSKFAQAIIKSTKEGIQRVSLNAQVEGLTAQKDTLREQITQLRQLVASLQGQVQTQLDILDQQIASAEAAAEEAESQISGQTATNLAAAAGFSDMGDGNTYIKWSEGQYSSGTTVVGFYTKCKRYSGPGEWKGGETLEIQNLKDEEGVTVTGVQISVTSQSGGKWKGSKNWFKPSSQPTIARGERGSVTMAAENWVHGQNGGSNQVQPSDDLYDTAAFGIKNRRAKTHTGAFTLKITYSDNSSISKSFNWKLQKDKD